MKSLRVLFFPFIVGMKPISPAVSRKACRVFSREAGPNSREVRGNALSVDCTTGRRIYEHLRFHSHACETPAKPVSCTSNGRGIDGQCRTQVVVCLDLNCRRRSTLVD